MTYLFKREICWSKMNHFRKVDKKKSLRQSSLETRYKTRILEIIFKTGKNSLL